MKPKDHCSFVVAFILLLDGTGSFEEQHLTANEKNQVTRWKRSFWLIGLGNNDFHTEAPVYIRPVGSTVYTPCITCTTMNQIACCQFYSRCCRVTAENPALKPGICPTMMSVSYCTQRCSSDAQCTGGTKCCPPAAPVCVTPLAGPICPINLPASTILLRSCIQGQAVCDPNEMCCPNPLQQGCCTVPQGTAIVNVPQILSGR